MDEPANVEIRTDNIITSTDTDDVLDPADARALHGWPDTLPETDDPLTVAIMDSGIHPETVETHPWFDGIEVVDRYDAVGAGTPGDDVGHGTACASVYARNTPDVELVSVRIFGKNGRTGFGTIKDAYKWLTDNAARIDIVNMSWGASQDYAPINALHDNLLAAGVHDVVAAGNTGTDGGSPATAERAFSAGAVDGSGRMARFSSSDPNHDNPDVAAVGVDVKLARAPDTAMGRPLNDQYVAASGTSFAAPYTGAAMVNAMYAADAGSWDKRFERRAADIPGTPRDGAGVLKLSAAVDGGEGSDRPTTDADVWNFAGSDTMFLDAQWLPTGETTVTRLEETKEYVDLRVSK